MAKASPPSALLTDLEDRTEYTFTSPATGRKLLADFTEEPMPAHQFDDYVESVIARVQDFFSARLLRNRSVTLAVGHATILHFELPPQPDSTVSQEQRTALCQLPSGKVGKLTLVSDKGDPGAEAEFERLLKSLHPRSEVDVFSAVREAVEAPKSRWASDYPIGGVGLELTADYVRPSLFRFRTPSLEHFTLSLGGEAVAPTRTATSLAATEATQKGPETLPINHLWSKRPSAKKSKVKPKKNALEVVEPQLASSRSAEKPIQLAGKSIRIQSLSSSLDLEKLTAEIEKTLQPKH